MPLVLCQAAAGFGLRALLHTDGAVVCLVGQQVEVLRVARIVYTNGKIVPLGRINKVKDMGIINGSVRHIGIKGDGNTAVDIGVGEHTVHIHPSGRNALYLFINGFICGRTGILLTVIKVSRQSTVLHHHINTAHITAVLGGAVVRTNVVAVAGHILPGIVRGKVPGNQVAVGGIAGLHSSLGRGCLTERLGQVVILHIGNGNNAAVAWVQVIDGAIIRRNLRITLKIGSIGETEAAVGEIVHQHAVAACAGDGEHLRAFCLRFGDRLKDLRIGSIIFAVRIRGALTGLKGVPNFLGTGVGGSLFLIHHYIAVFVRSNICVDHTVARVKEQLFLVEVLKIRCIGIPNLRAFVGCRIRLVGREVNHILAGYRVPNGLRCPAHVGNGLGTAALVRGKLGIGQFVPVDQVVGPPGVQTGIIIVVGGVGVRCHHIILILCTILRLHNIRIARVAGALRSTCHRHAAVQGLVIIAILRYGVKNVLTVGGLGVISKIRKQVRTAGALGQIAALICGRSGQTCKRQAGGQHQHRQEQRQQPFGYSFSHRIYLHKSLSLPSGIKSAHCLLTTQHRRQILPAAYGYTYPHSFTE